MRIIVKLFLTIRYGHHSSFLSPATVIKFQQEPRYLGRQIQAGGKNCYF